MSFMSIRGMTINTMSVGLPCVEHNRTKLKNKSKKRLAWSIHVLEDGSYDNERS